MSNISIAITADANAQELTAELNKLTREAANNNSFDQLKSAAVA